MGTNSMVFKWWMRLFFMKTEQKNCLKIIRAFTWEKKENKPRKISHLNPSPACFRASAWFQWAALPETVTSTLVLLGHLMGHSDAVCLYPASAYLQISLSMLIWITTLQETSSAETFLQYIWITKKCLLFGKLFQELLTISVQWSRKAMISE